MFGDAYPYRADEITILPEGDLLRALRERVKGKDPVLAKNLFLYRHNMWENFVISQWLGKPRDLRIDIMNLGKDGPGGFDSADMKEFLKRALDPLSAEEIMQTTANEEYKWLMMQQEWQAEEKERLEKIARGE